MNNETPAQQVSLSPLAETDLELLRMLVGRFGGISFSEQAWKEMSSMNRSGAELKLSFIHLRKHGWVQAVKKSWGERLYFIPVDKLIQLLPVFFTPVSRPVDESGLDIRCESGPGLVLDLLHTLAYTAEQGIPLTAKGTIHKKSLQKLQELIYLREMHLERLGLQYAHQEMYGPAPAVILDLLLCIGLLSKTAVSLIIVEERLRDWLSLTEQEMNRVLLRTVSERYSRNEADMQLFRYLICLPSFQEGMWFDVSSVLQWMDTEGMLEADNSMERAAAWLYALAGFGWGDVAEMNDGKYVFRWNTDPVSLLFETDKVHEPKNDSLYVQPDFDIICPPGVPYIQRWKLLACADLIQSDRMSVYKLTRSSVAKAVENGMRTVEILSFLTATSAHEIPGHVEAALEQWGKEIGRTRFDEVLLLSCVNEDEGDAIAANPRMDGRVDRIGPKHFIIPTSHVAESRKILESMGLAPLKSMGSRDREDPEYPLIHNNGEISDTPRGSLLNERIYENQGVVYSGRNVHFFEADHEIPEPASLFPGHDQVPSRWLHDYRSYHSSTAQNIIEQAQSWQTRVLLQHAGRRAEFAPLRINLSPWRAEGILHDVENDRFEQMELFSDDLGELKLILPSFD
ncbi:helicase-associated domain-containing protein [Paenibacillus dokdonensis]|uniref:Helicase-associated domain-containing protein n=1 Tax=Paenibacillus dokdonensis TaxID=2567944 RepID=A0ABU6GUW7_9BACL|nr:helicase-associated domain-containing protein [Paenibacillus dokdonensis]MEC0243555.1 helicase-associated domain-containing protein [Paenibacillus dokdonensis]